jgi:hypothetical protein
VYQGLAQAPYRAGTRRFWIVDNGAAHRGATAKRRRHQGESRLLRVQTPVQASGLNQVEISCSIIQRKVLTPKACANWEAIQRRLAVDEELSNQRPTPLQGTFDRTQLGTLLAKIEAHQKLLADSQSDCTEAAASSGHHL